MKRRVLVGSLLAVFLGLSVTALAMWLSGGDGAAGASARTMPAGDTPVATANSGGVALTWTAPTFPDGTPVQGVIVNRYDASGNLLTIGGTCTGVVTGIGCNDAGGNGQVKYTITPAHQNWRGAASAYSNTVQFGTCTINFTKTGTSQLWNTAANWDLNRVPNSSDEVCIPNLGGSVSLSLFASSTVSRVTAQQPLLVSSGSTLTVTGTTKTSSFTTLTVQGTLNVAGPATAGTVSTSGVVAGNGSWTVTNAFNWTGGSLNGTGTTTVASTASLSISSSAKTIGTGRVFQTYSPSGDWSASSAMSVNGTFENYGTINVHPSTDASIASGTGNFRNLTGARIVKTGTTLASIATGRLSNAGTVDVQSGTFGMDTATGATNPDIGSVTVASGATLRSITGPRAMSGPISGAGTLLFTGGTHTLTGDVTVPTITASGGNATFSGTSITPTTLNVNGGAVTFSTTMTIPTVNVTAGSLAFDAATTISSALVATGGVLNGTGTLTNSGTLTWGAAGFFGTGNFVQNGTTTMTGTGARSTSKNITVNGSVDWQGGGLAVNSVTFETFAAVNITSTTAVALTGSNGTAKGVQVRAGSTWTISGGATVTASGSSNNFLNSGSVVITNGTFVLATPDWAGPQPGSYSAASPTATFQLGCAGGASCNVSGSVTADTGGTVSMTGGGTSTMTGTYKATNTNVSGTGLTLSGPIATLTNITVSAGTLNINNAPSTATTTTTVTGGTLSGSAAWTTGTLTMSGTGAISGNATATVTGTFSVPSGTPTITRNKLRIDPSATATLTVATTVNTPGVLEVAGTLNQASTVSGTGTVNVLSGATANMTGAGPWALPAFSNAGTVTMGNNSLQINGGGTDTGSYSVGTGTLRFSSGTRTESATITSSGTVEVAGGTVTITKPLSTPTLTITGGTLSAGSNITTTTFTQSAGTLSGSGTTTVNGAFSWTAGTQGPNGSTIVDPGATLTMNNAAVTLNGRLLQTLGTGTISGTTFAMSLSGSAVFDNSGTLTYSAGASTAGFSGASPAYVQNAGIWTIPTGAQVNIQSGLTFLNVNPGVLAVSGAVSLGNNTSLGGTTNLITSSATVSTAAVSLTIPSSGTVNGIGTINANLVVNQGTISPGNVATTSGTLTLTGNYSQSGTLNIDINDTTADQLAVNSAATLDGTLNATTNTAPSSGTEFSVVTFASASGTFSTVPSAAAYTTSYTPTAAKLTRV